MNGPPRTIVRRYVATDRAEWRRMRFALWPDQTPEDMDSWLARPDAVIFVAERASGGGLCAFAEAGERSYAEGCRTSPVAYLEGWFVDPDSRGQGVGAALVRAVEDWARSLGRSELASDAEIDNLDSLHAHERLGFEEVDRSVHFRKAIVSGSSAGSTA